MSPLPAGLLRRAPIVSDVEILLEEGFDDNNAGLTARGWYDGNSATIATTGTHSGGGCLQASFSSGGSTPSWVIKRHLFTPTSTLYVSVWIKHSSNWVGSGEIFHPHELMFLSEFDGEWAPLAENILNTYIEHNYSAASGGLVPNPLMQDSVNINYENGALPNDLTAVTEDRSVCGCNGVIESTTDESCFDNGGGIYYNAKTFRAASASIVNDTQASNYKGNWNHVEAYMAMNSVTDGVAANDGILQFWVNGTLYIDRDDIQYCPGVYPSMRWRQIAIAPFMNSSPVAQTVFYDDLLIATGRPIPPQQTAATLTFVQAPVNTLEDTVITPAVRVGVLDTAGNLVTAATNAVSVAIASGTGSLSGDVSNNAVAGIATFNDLQIDTPGAFTLQATSPGLVPVTSPSFNIDPTPGGPTGWPNEPTGMTLVTDYAFSDVIPTSGGGVSVGSGWFVNGSANCTRITDSTAPQSPSNVMEMRYPLGFAGGSAPAAMFYNVGSANELYIGCYWKPSNPWDFHSSDVNKIFFMFDANGVDAGILKMQNNRTIGVTSEYGAAQNRPANVNPSPVTLGQWHLLEWYFKRSTNQMMWWVNGVLQGNYSNIPYPGASFGEFKLDPTWGGVGDNKETADYYRYDHIRISKRA